jgi:beta-aspartyl-peptidase (threonine type)
VMARVASLGGAGGLIAIDQHARVAMPFTTPGMYRGYKLASGESAIDLFGSETV